MCSLHNWKFWYLQRPVSFLISFLFFLWFMTYDNVVYDIAPVNFWNLPYDLFYPPDSHPKRDVFLTEGGCF